MTHQLAHAFGLAILLSLSVSPVSPALAEDGAPRPLCDEPPPAERDPRFYVAFDSGTYVTVEPLDVQGYFHHSLGAQWREGPRIGLSLDLLHYHWSQSTGALQSGTTYYVGVEAGTGFRFDALTLRLDAYAEVAPDTRPRSARDQVRGVGGLLGGSVAVGYRIDSRFEMGVRILGGALLDEHEGVEPMARAGLFLEIH